ncbi:unnamed protein product, partial [Ectocarpus sp. 8 AP-2014]
MATEGRTGYLDAFVVALSQACEGGEKRWYASTLELQLTSLDMCRACRSTSILHVRVNHLTPHSLWSSRTTQTWPNTRSSRLRVSSRVPVVRALGLMWALSMEDLLRKASIELWTWSQRLELQGSWCASSLGSEVVWPRGLTELVLHTDSAIATDNVWWPAHLQYRSFGSNFNQPVAGVVWPTSLQQLSFGSKFNQPIAGVAWPSSLQQLSFGIRFNQAIAGVMWPSSLRQISFGRFFNQPIAGVLWPASLQQLSFGDAFNQPIAAVVLPAVVLPASLQQLSFGRFFNQPIAGVLWPASLQ